MTRLPSCLALVLALGFCFPAVARECPPLRPAQISIVPLPSRPSYDYGRNLAAMQTMAGTQREAFSSTDHEIPVGLTEAQLKLDSHFEVLINRPSTMDPVCAQISKFELRFGFEDTTVYLASELPQGSCSFQTVLQHEHRHVDMDNYLVQKYADAFPEMLRQAVTEIGVIRAASPEEAQGKLRDIVHNYMNDLGSNLTQVRQKYQQTIDTKDEYSRISISCNGQMSQILRAAAKPRFSP